MIVLWAASAFLCACATLPPTSTPDVSPGRSLLLTIEGDPHRIELVGKAADRDIVITNLDDGEVFNVRMTPAVALGYLADRRFEPFWQAIERWAGAGLRAQRERPLAELPVGDLAAISAEALTSPPQDNLFEQVYTLRLLGRYDEAHSLLDHKADPTYHRAEALAIARSNLFKTAGETDRAIAVLSTYVASNSDKALTLQALTNLAELQIEADHLAQGAHTLQQRERLLRAERGGDYATEDEWVQSCLEWKTATSARQQATIMENMRSSWRTVTDPDVSSQTAPKSSNIAPNYFRFGLCIGDGDVLVDVLEHDFHEGRVPYLGTWLFQDAYMPIDPDHAKAIAQARGDPRMEELSQSIRQLPVAYDAAVNNWRPIQP